MELFLCLHGIILSYKGCKNFDWKAFRIIPPIVFIDVEWMHLTWKKRLPSPLSGIPHQVPGITVRALGGGVGLDVLIWSWRTSVPKLA